MALERYSRNIMKNIWSEQTKYSIWLEIEIAVCEALAERGIIPYEAAEDYKKNAKFDVNKIHQIEQVVKHDVIAFLTNVAESVGNNARFAHLGLTSSDVLDTCLSVQLVRATDILLEDIKLVLEALKEKAYATKDIMCIGRSHGIHAEPMSFGLKFASFYAEFQRNLERLENARKDIAVCAISGAVGTFANVDPSIELYVANQLKLEVETISSQVIPRDRHANFFSTLAIIASSIERIAVEIRHLQRTEVLEVEECFTKGQKGSSAMPHKRNPILSENLTGLCRMVRSAAIPALENVALWHERDISHSSVERFIGPDATITLDFALHRLHGLLSGLVIHEDNVKRNLELSKELYCSQRILLALVGAGMSREDAYQCVQNHAMQSWNGSETFRFLILGDNQITQYLSQKQIEELFDLEYHHKNTDHIFTKVFDE